MGENTRLAPIDQANLLAAHAVSYATAYLRGDHDAAKLADNADRLFLDLLVMQTAETSRFLIPVQLLAVTMMQTARRAGEIGLIEKFEAVMGSLVELVCEEGRSLAQTKQPEAMRR